MTKATRRGFLAAAATMTGGGLLSAPAIAAAPVREVRMVTSWPKNMPGPGVSAERLAAEIGRLSEGRLKIRVHAAGELVPPLAVFDAVQNGTAEMAHTASLFWSGKMPAAALFTAAPYGLSPVEHQAWLENDGGQALWEELYAPFGIRPLLAGNTGPSMGGWFRRPIHSLEDFRGLKMRMPGLGGRIIRRMGATPVTLPPGEILPALQAGTIDATEFLGPFGDMALGLHKVAKTYHYPAFHEPNGAGELLVSRKLWEELEPDQRLAVEVACRSEAARTLAEHSWRNGTALQALRTKHGVRVLPYPQDVLTTARKAAEEVMVELAAHDAISRRIVESMLAARRHMSDWSDMSTRAFLQARIS